MNDWKWHWDISRDHILILRGQKGASIDIGVLLDIDAQFGLSFLYFEIF